MVTVLSAGSFSHELFCLLQYVETRTFNYLARYLQSNCGSIIFRIALNSKDLDSVWLSLRFTTSSRSLLELEEGITKQERCNVT